MKALLRHGMVLLAAVAGIGLASAPVAWAQIDTDPAGNQKRIVEPKIVAPKDGIGTPTAQFRLTDEQRNAIAVAVGKDNKVVTPPPSFVVQVGAPVPPAIELYLLPDNALSEIPAAKTVKYTVLNDQLVLVDPTTMRVVDVIKK